ncbi:MAG TPA: hypothetical protein VFC56_12730 [Stellaceae bacterium]|nr:hypothetical protein [Stellaceae bacterium]
MTGLPGSVLAMVILGGLGLPAAAQQKMPMSGIDTGGKKMPGVNMDDLLSNTPYHPGLGELMTSFVQPRHIKLGLAGAAQNWAYAAYELGELQETFDDVGKLVLKHGALAIPQAVQSTVKQPMDALDAAIKAKDAAAFTKGYADLTTACNACHQSADHPMIVIQVPTVSGAAFPDQDFRPQPPK